MTISRLRLLRVPLLLAGLAACADDPTGTPPAPEPTPQVQGVYEFTVTGLGGPDVSASASAAPKGPSLDLGVVDTGLSFELVSSGSFTEGTRGQGGQRYVSVTYRVRNTTGAPLTNLTFIPASSASTIPGTPFTSLTLFSGGQATPALAPNIAPTGAVSLGAGTELRATDADVLQVFTESEIAAITPPAGITGLFPYGFVTRTPSGRTVAPSTGPADYTGVVTFAFRVPLASAGATADPFTISFHAVAVQDTETRLTESMEEAQDTAAVRRLRERAAALGATAVTVLPGSPAAGPEGPDYAGQRQICSVRTAGAAGSPTAFINRIAAYTRILVLRPGETPSTCGAGFRAGTPEIAAPGTPYTLRLRAMDRYGNMRSAADSVRVQRVSGPLVTVDPEPAMVAGQSIVQVSFAANGNAVLRLAGRRYGAAQQVDVGAPTVQVSAGNRQAAMGGTLLPARPAVLVKDGAGNPLPGRAVTFSITGGGGTATDAVVTTDAAGIARVGAWMLGSVADLNTMTATVAGTGVTGNPANFQASGCQGGGGPGYAITLCFSSTFTPSQRTVFESAVARWQGLVTGDLPGVPINQPVGFCGSAMPALNMTVDDLVIFAAIQPLDGPGGVLGSAGPCWLRDSGHLPVVGLMRFDTDDVAGLETSGRLGNVILHEMGHVLGIGTIWPDLNLVQNPTPAGGPPLDSWFSGAGGIAGFNAIGGATYTGGQKVPVENTGSAARMNTHWRESVLVNELMTPSLNPGINPLSVLSVRSLADLGYTVNQAGADPFFLTLSLRANAGQGESLPLIGDVETGPIHRQDARGRVIRHR
ncbi:leishmanolysin-related zinc metalloendopeptidase [Longimicrobium sp.]|uniref:leishmanolysin-related zinc metalloendopeptidase n=1 Tax=Longimicrobium sp. TaxID=2029185 RepID=UPI003B3BA93F